MFSSLMCAVGLAACCGLSILHDQPQIKAAISESVGNNQVTTPVTYGEFVIDDTKDSNFTAVNFDSPSPIYNVDNFNAYGNRVLNDNSTFTYDGLNYANYFNHANENIGEGFDYNFDLVCISGYSASQYGGNLYFTFGINTDYAKSLSDDGVNVYFDLLTQNFNIDITLCTFEVRYYQEAIFDVSSAALSNTFEYNDVYVDFLTGYDPVGADYNFSPFSYQYPYNFYESEHETYVNGYNLGVSSSFVNTNTNGYETFSRPFMWNHLVYVIHFNGNALSTYDSPFGDNIFVQYSMKGLETNSNGAYESGYNAGRDAGYAEGAAASQQEAYNNGFRAGQASAQNVTWTGLFGSIADTPIIMLRGMFNFDLFGMNVLSVVLTLLTAIVVLRIVLKILL